MLVSSLVILAIVIAVIGHGTLLKSCGIRALCVLLALDLVIAVLAAASGYSAVWEDWMREDAWVEWATALSFGVAGALFIQRARSKENEAPVRFFLLGLALFCVFAAGEELSWGQRLLGFEPPEYFLAENFQQEANLHNLVTNKELLGISLDSRNLLALLAGGYGVLFALLGAALRKVSWAQGFAPSLLVTPYFAVACAMEVAYPWELTGEAAEWLLGMSFLADAILRRDSDSKEAWLLPGVVLFALAIVPVLDTLLFGSDQARVDLAREEIDLLGDDLEKSILPKLLNKGRVHKRVHTAVLAEYFAIGNKAFFLGGELPAAEAEAGEGRRDRQGYFLDPWKNPYWVFWDRSEGRLALYSFGPNRRRDVDIGRGSDDWGDDIILVLRD